MSSVIDDSSYRMISLTLLLLVGCHSVRVQAEQSSNGWQSLLNLSNFGKTFSSKDQQTLLLLDINADSLQVCLQVCHANILCRIFDFDGQTNRCRLFEGNMNTMGSIITSSSSLSVVGILQLIPGQFSNISRPCSFCSNSRYLICVNSTCQCPSRTYFDGSICRSQNLLGSECANATDCRMDLNMTCLPRKQCGPLSLQYGTTVGGYSNGTAGNASDALASPFGIVATDDGSLFVGEYRNARVIRLSANSLIGTIVAGTGIVGNSSAQLNDPSHLYVDAAWNIYVSDTSNERAMFWSNGSSAGVSITGATRINMGIRGITVDSHKNIYIAETYNHRVTKWAPNATNGTIIAGTGTSGSDNQHLAYPFGLYLDELHSYLYVADYWNNRIQRFTLGNSTNGTTVAGGHGSGLDNNQLYQPQGVYVSKKTGAIYIADTFNNRITRWYPGATSGVTIVGIDGVTGTTALHLYGPAGVALSPNETYLYVSDLNNNRIQRFELI